MASTASVVVTKNYSSPGIKIPFSVKNLIKLSHPSLFSGSPDIPAIPLRILFLSSSVRALNSALFVRALKAVKKLLP
jgi:hypothetical protein